MSGQAEGGARANRDVAGNGAPAAAGRHRKLAAVYARALVDAGTAAGSLAEVLGELDELVDSVLAGNARFAAILASRIVSPDEKRAIVERVFGGRASPLLLGLLRTMAKNERLGILSLVRDVAWELYEAQMGRVRVEVTTATPLGPVEAERIRAGLAGLVAGEPRLVPRVDPDLIGGLVLRIQDKVFDASVATQLALARRQMIERTAHEIQSGRDRFRHPA